MLLVLLPLFVRLVRRSDAAVAGLLVLVPGQQVLLLRRLYTCSVVELLLPSVLMPGPSVAKLVRTSQSVSGAGGWTVVLLLPSVVQLVRLLLSAATKDAVACFCAC